TPDYFRSLQIPLLQGRVFTDHDNEAAPPAVVINQVASGYFGGENPVGKRVTFGARDRDNQPIWHQVIGVDANLRSPELQKEARPEFSPRAVTGCVRDSASPHRRGCPPRQSRGSRAPGNP